jgi:hypothetical protein
VRVRFRVRVRVRVRVRHRVRHLRESLGHVGILLSIISLTALATPCG